MVTGANCKRRYPQTDVGKVSLSGICLLGVDSPQYRRQNSQSPPPELSAKSSSALAYFAHLASELASARSTSSC